MEAIKNTNVVRGHKLTTLEVIHLKRGTVLKAIDGDGRTILFDYDRLTLSKHHLRYQKDFMYISGKPPYGFDESKRIACNYDACIYLDVVSDEETKKFREAVDWISMNCPKDEIEEEYQLSDPKEEKTVVSVEDKLIVVTDSLNTVVEEQSKLTVDDQLFDKKCVLFRNEEKQLHPFATKVLVSDGPGDIWRLAIFGCKTDVGPNHYVVVGGVCYRYCIPWYDNKLFAGKLFHKDNYDV